MRIDAFEYEFARRGGVFLSENANGLVLFKKPLELYNMAKKETLQVFKSLKTAYMADVGGITLKQLIESWDTIPQVTFRGGRGANSGSNDYEQKWPSSNNHEKDRTTSDLPARMNVKNDMKRTYDDMVQTFVKTHGADNYESGITVDADGFVTRYRHGNAGSVAISGSKGEIIVHNHPFDGWPNFSKEDLLVAAAGQERGIVAVSTTTGRSEDSAKYAGTYTFVKGGHFNASAFTKAINNATIKGKDYNDAVTKWLKANQKKYGYTYSYKK